MLRTACFSFFLRAGRFGTVFPFQRNITAKGKSAQTVLGAFVYLFEQGRAHANGKFQNLNSAEFGTGEVTKLVEQNHDAKGNHGSDQSNNGGHEGKNLTFALKWDEKTEANERLYKANKQKQSFYRNLRNVTMMNSITVAAL